MQLIQRDEDQARKLGSRLRHGTRNDMRRRRGVFGLFLTAAASLSVIALYQMGILDHVPEPRVPRLDSDAVTGSAKAYSLLETPDAVLAKVGVDAAVAAKYTVDEWKRHRALCFWCFVASAATFASVPLVIPEARRALRTLL